MKTVKLIKLKEADNPLYPKNIPDGYVKEGEFIEPPKVGDAFWVGGTWRTSDVQEILSHNTFRTHNSIYKYEILENADAVMNAHGSIARNDAE